MGIKKYYCNENIFSQDSESSFYVAGFIAADGSIHRHSRNGKISRIRIGLSTKDKAHLKTIKCALSSNHKLYDYHAKLSRTGYTLLEISSRKMCYDLYERFNVEPKKSKTYKFPVQILDSPHLYHFMRGYFDGDGSVFKRQNRDSLVVCLRGTYSFLSTYKSVLVNRLSVADNKVIFSGGAHMLRFSSKRDVANIYNYFYGNASLFLKRKKDIFNRR